MAFSCRMLAFPRIHRKPGSLEDDGMKASSCLLIFPFKFRVFHPVNADRLPTLDAASGRRWRGERQAQR
jgi:hypothetical protein